MELQEMGAAHQRPETKDFEGFEARRGGDHEHMRLTSQASQELEDEVAEEERLTKEEVDEFRKVRHSLCAAQGGPGRPGRRSGRRGGGGAGATWWCRAWCRKAGAGERRW